MRIEGTLIRRQRQRLSRPRRKVHNESEMTGRLGVQVAESRDARWGLLRQLGMPASSNPQTGDWHPGQLRSHFNHFLPLWLPSQSQGYQTYWGNGVSSSAPILSPS